ncbi:hypothetical protein DXT89_08615 [Agrobacterium vitis]|uniref:Uncharacterized protein n=1 Tax=Agrobacterium vitis TaxID=373 RepID=A0A368NS55_AGRVI|nr:hypothetical protein DXM22_11090 [Agrobacterium vitis]KAA3529755.1 hypothetical protein DXT89_08615 [Agrobacterium vitis]RCU52309.1 hypothetical protein ASB66_019450 [Agrobacterium vitis]
MVVAISNDNFPGSSDHFKEAFKLLITIFDRKDFRRINFCQHRYPSDRSFKIISFWKTFKVKFKQLSI